MNRKQLEMIHRIIRNSSHPELSGVLRAAMSRRHRDAVNALSAMSVTLLTHLIKYVALPGSRARIKWLGEVKGYISRFNVKNLSPQNHPWLTVEEITRDLNEDLSSPAFERHLSGTLETHAAEKKKIINLYHNRKTLRSWGLSLIYDSKGDLQVFLNGEKLL